MAQEYADVLETNDFFFKSLQKVRLISSENLKSQIDGGRWLAVSSQLQIGIAVQGGNSFVAFSTADIHKLNVNKQNINQEFENLPKKVVNVHVDGASIVTVSVNSDGAQLGVLINTKVGPFVYIYDVRAFSLRFTGNVLPTHEIRIGASPNSMGLSFEWNPAMTDTFAATGSDKTIIVTKVDFMKNGAFSMIGEKCFGAVVGVISWSPKGKQLSVGDNVGKIIQLKPELDVVRSTLPQTELASPKVVGLFWLATTEWVVAYGKEGEDKMDAGILTIKKDKSITMHRLVDLQFGMKDAKRSAGFYGIALGEWNVVVSSSNRLSEVIVVGKQSDHWQTWQLNESSRFDLPITTEATPSFPIGIAVDRSAQTEIVLADDGSRRCHAMPIVMVLTSDGVLASAHAITANSAHASIQISPQSIDLSDVHVGIAASGTVSTASLIGVDAAVKPAGGLFGGTAASQIGGGLLGGVTKPPVSLFGGSPSSASSTISTTSSLFGGAAKPTGSLFGATLTTAAGSVNNTSPDTKKNDSVLAVTGPIELLKEKDEAAAKSNKKADLEAAEKLRMEQETKVASESQAALVQKRLQVKEKFQKIEKDLASLRLDEERLSEALQQAKNTPTEEPVQKYHREVLVQLHQLADEITGDQNMILHSLKQITWRIGEQSVTVNDAKDSKTALLLLKEHDSFDRDERMKRLEESILECKTQYAETKKVVESIKNLKKIDEPVVSYRDPKTDAKLVDVISRMSIFSQMIRIKEDKLERDIKRLERQMNQQKSGQKESIMKATEHEIVEEISANCGTSDVSRLRDKIRKLCKARSSKVRRVTPQITALPKPNTNFKQEKSDLTRVQKLLEESLRVSPSAAKKSSDVIKFTVATQSPDPRDFANAAAAAATQPLPSSPFVIQKPAVQTSSLVTQKTCSPLLESKFTSATNTIATSSINNSIFGSLTSGTPKVDKKATHAGPALSDFLSSKTENSTKPGLSGFGTTAIATELKKQESKSEKPIFGGASPLVQTGVTSESAVTELKSSEDKKVAVPTEKEKVEDAKTASDKEKNEVSFSATFELPSKSSLVEGNATTVTSVAPVSSAETKPVFSLGFPGSAALSNTITSTKDVKPPLSFGETATSSVITTTSADSQQAFSFIAATTAATTSINSTTSTSKTVEAKPKFSFEGASTASSGTSSSVTDSKPTFSFGGSFSSTSTTTASSTGSKPTFNFSDAAATATAASTASSSVFGGGAVVSTSSSIFGGGASSETAAKSSIFGGSKPSTTGSVFGGSPTPSVQSSSTSIFGGSSTTKGSIFGGAASTTGGSIFGSGTSITPASGNVAFSFKKSDAQAALAPQSNAFNFNKPGSGGFAAAAAAAASSSDDGMMEEGQFGAQPQSGGIFGGSGFMSGLGSSNPTSSTGSKTIFGSGGMNIANPGQSSSWLFNGSGNTQTQSSQQTGGSIFGSGNAQQGSSMFGGSPKFGASPAFGAKPVFGSKPSFGGSPAPVGSIFGGTQATNTNSGFSAFAGKSVGFGGLASQQQQQPSSSVFGGNSTTTFGSKPSGSFASWR